MAEGLVRVAGLGAPGEEVAEPVQAHGDIAHGLRRAGVVRQQLLGEVEAAGVVLLDLGGVARLPALDEHVAHLSVRCVEEAAGFGVRRGGLVPARGEGVGLLGIGKRGDEGVVVFVLDALVEEEPREGAERGGPGGVALEQLAVGGAGGGGVALRDEQIGGAEERGEPAAQALAVGGELRVGLGEQARLFPSDEGERGVRALVGEDAGEFAADARGLGAALQFGEAGDGVINAREAGGVGGKRAFAEALAFVGLGSFIGNSEVGIALALGALQQVSTDVGGRDALQRGDGVEALPDFVRRYRWGKGRGFGGMKVLLAENLDVLVEARVVDAVALVVEGHAHRLGATGLQFGIVGILLEDQDDVSPGRDCPLEFAAHPVVR